MKFWKLKNLSQLSHWKYFRRLQERSFSPLVGIPTLLQFCPLPEVIISNQILYVVDISKFVTDKKKIFKSKIICEVQKVIFFKQKILHLSNCRSTKYSNSLFPPNCLHYFTYAYNSKLTSFCPNVYIITLKHLQQPNSIYLQMKKLETSLSNLTIAQILVVLGETSLKQMFLNSIFYSKCFSFVLFI